MRLLFGVSIVICGTLSVLHGEHGSTCAGGDVKWSKSRDRDRRIVLSVFAPDSSSLRAIGGAINRLLSRKADNLGDWGGASSICHTMNKQSRNDLL